MIAGHRRRRVLAVLVAISIALVTFVYRFDTLGGPFGGFDNDHFAHLVRAEAVLGGELPLRDFSEAELRGLWPPLMYSTSAMAQRILGHSLRSEALLTIGMLSIGAAGLYWIAADLAQAWWLAALVTLLGVGLSPTLYNYPKIAPYVAAVMAMLAYARRPARFRLAVLALTVVVAALFRHDHGVYLGVSSGVLILLVAGRHSAPSLGWFALFLLIGMLPGIVFAQRYGGFIAYLRECIEESRHEAGRTTAASAGFVIDWAQPLFASPTISPAPPPRIGVLWARDLTPEARAMAEAALGLSDPVPRSSDRNWSYAVTVPSADRLAAIVRDVRIEDTDGIDRQALTVTATPELTGLNRWPQRVALFRGRLAPGVLRQENAAPWLHLVGWTVVLLSAAIIGYGPLRRAIATPAVPTSVLAAIVVLGVLMLVTFLRNPSPQRLADASVPITVLGAWLLAALPRAARTRTMRFAIVVVFTLALVLTGLSVSAVGTVPEQIVGTGLTEGRLRGRWAEVWNGLGALPESSTGIDAALGRATSYLRRCTTASDRVLVGDNMPEINYFASRGFAAGQSAFFSGFYSSESAQRRTIARWGTQSVPVALIQPPERFANEFGNDYGLLAQYLRSHYRRAGSLEVERGRALDVWVSADRQSQRDAETGLPCFK